MKANTQTQLNEMASRILDDIIDNGYTNDISFNILCIAQKAETGDMGTLAEEDPFEDYSKKAVKDLSKCILKKTERMLKECERSYYLTACLIEMLSELNELKNLKYTTKKIEICKELVRLFMGDEMDVEAGVLRMKILD